MMNTNELVITSDKVTTAVRIQAQVNMIQEVMKKVMKVNVHYGVIPGCKKPSLYKPGAEKIMATFRLVADNPIVEDLSTLDSIRYRVTQRILTPDGALVGSASGECSSDEEKYKWRRPVCDEEFNDTPEDRRREKWSKYQGKAEKNKQIRTNPSDVANTILKMAVKRALVAAVLVSTAASDVFDQDIEDLPDGILNEDSPVTTKPSVAEPQAKKTVEAVAQAPAANEPLLPTDAPLDIVNAMEALVGSTFSVKGIIFDWKTRSVNTKKGPNDITDYTISDGISTENLLKISKWGALQDGVAGGLSVVFSGVTVSLYKEKRQYMAQGLEVVNNG